MAARETIESFLAGAAGAAAEAEREAARKAARITWAQEAVTALMAAQQRVTEAWDRIFDALPDDLSDEEVDNLPAPPEQAEVDALYAQIAAVRDHDRWPRELYWSL